MPLTTATNTVTGGAYWYTEDENNIKIRRGADDQMSAYHFNEVRVLIWKLPLYFIPIFKI